MVSEAVNGAFASIDKIFPPLASPKFSPSFENLSASSPSILLLNPGSKATTFPSAITSAFDGPVKRLTRKNWRFLLMSDLRAKFFKEVAADLQLSVKVIVFISFEIMDVVLVE